MGLSHQLFSTSAGRAVGRMIHRRALLRQPRSQSLATALFRNIRQVSAFEGPLADIPEQRSMRILVAGCSIGCEAYTLAGYLAARFPALNFAIEAFDIDPGAIERAKTRAYGAEHMHESALAGPFADVVAKLLRRDGAVWRVEDEIAGTIRFSVDDALRERPADENAFDVVLAQNFMIHMDDAMAGLALANLSACIRPGGAMFLGGMSLDMRAAATAAAGLDPVDWRVAEIHEEDVVRRNAWPFAYWSLEPYDSQRPDPLARYATIFRKR